MSEVEVDVVKQDNTSWSVQLLTSKIIFNQRELRCLKTKKLLFMLWHFIGDLHRSKFKFKEISSERRCWSSGWTEEIFIMKPCLWSYTTGLWTTCSPSSWSSWWSSTPSTWGRSWTFRSSRLSSRNPSDLLLDSSLSLDSCHYFHSSLVGLLQRINCSGWTHINISKHISKFSNLKTGSFCPGL